MRGSIFDIVDHDQSGGRQRATPARTGACGVSGVNFLYRGCSSDSKNWVALADPSDGDGVAAGHGVHRSISNGGRAALACVAAASIGLVPRQRSVPAGHGVNRSDWWTATRRSRQARPSPLGMGSFAHFRHRRRGTLSHIGASNGRERHRFVTLAPTLNAEGADWCILARTATTSGDRYRPALLQGRGGQHRLAGIVGLPGRRRQALRPTGPGR
jgi:hypothetical protein